MIRRAATRQRAAKLRRVFTWPRAGCIAAAIVAIACTAAGTSAAPPHAPPTLAPLAERVDAALVRAAAWLAAQQADDGGWHSALYGQMRTGAGNTALAAYALAGLPAHLRAPHEEHLARGLAFLTRDLHPAGFVRGAEGASDYPNYATALAASALIRARRGNSGEASAADRDNLLRMRTYLLAAQQTAPLPWSRPGDPRGGWSLIGGDPGDPASFRDANISATRLAAQSLHATHAGVDETASAWQAPAIAFATALQNPNGGFRFVPQPDDPLNKAGLEHNSPTGSPTSAELSPAEPPARSYGSATADGLCTLIACGVPPDDPRITIAIHWLDEHVDVTHVPGFEVEPNNEPNTDHDAEANRQPRDASAREGLLFYYRAALAQAMTLALTAEFAARRSDLCEQLLHEQRPDGSWANPSPTMREDDPLIATPWAIGTLTLLQESDQPSAVSGQP